MRQQVVLVLSIVVSILLTFVITAFSIEYSYQKNKYGDDVIQTEIVSDIMQEKRKVIIHLPESYTENSNKRYPVTYVFDGTSQDTHIAAKADILSKVKQFPEAIVVGIPNTRGNRSRDLTPHYMKIDIDKSNSDLGNGDKMLQFIESELIPYVDSNYKTTDFRTLAGNSRGGLLTFYVLMEQPNLFDAYLCFSPAFWREDYLIVKKAKTFFEQNSNLNAMLFMSLGALENDKMKSGFNEMTTLIEQQKNNSLLFKSMVIDNANHQTNSYKSAIYGLDELGDYMLKNNIN